MHIIFSVTQVELFNGGVPKRNDNNEEADCVSRYKDSSVTIGLKFSRGIKHWARRQSPQFETDRSKNMTDGFSDLFIALNKVKGMKQALIDKINDGPILEELNSKN